jgi:O-antigen ligase
MFAFKAIKGDIVSKFFIISPYKTMQNFLRFFILGAVLLALSIMLGGFISQQGDKTIYFVAGVFVFGILFLRPEFILYGLLFSMLLSPEIIVGATSKREVTVRFEDFLILVMAFSWVIKIAIFKDPGLIIYSPINKRAALYLFLCAFSTTFGMLAGRVDINAGFLFFMKYVEFYLIYIIVLNSIKDRNSIKYYVVAMLLVCLVICVIGLVKYAQGEGVAAPFEGKGGVERNTLGGYLTLIFSFCLGLFIALRDWKFRAPLLALMTIILGTLMISLSRSSWIAVFAVLLFFIIFDHRLRKALIVVLLILPELLYLVAPQQTKDRLSVTLYQGRTQERQITVAGYRLDTSTSARLISFGEALDKAYVHPLLGWGITGFIFIDSQYFRALAEIGILGLLAFLLMIKNIWRMARETLDRLANFENGLVLGFLGGLVGVLVHAVGANTFMIVRIMEPFWFMAALVTYLHIHEFHPEVRQASN